MRFTLATVVAALPYLVSATIVPEQHGQSRSISLGKRSNLRGEDGVVNADNLRAHLKSTVGKIQRGAAAFERNTGARHPAASASTPAKRDVASDKLTDDSEELWYGKISVGTPAVTYTVDFDTGSSDLFLPGANCGSTCSGHTKYKHTASSTSKALGKSFSLAYGDGSTVKGKQYTDTVKIAGLTAKKQTLGSASQYSSGFESSNFPADGLMGMGFKSISEYNADPVFQTLVKDGETTDGVFAFKLSDSGAELTLGGLNDDLYSGKITYVDVTQEGYWQVDVDAVNVESDKVLGSTSAIIDSGTTLVVATTSDAKKFYDAIDGAEEATDIGDGYYTVPCDSIPDVSLTFGGKEFKISSDTFNLGQESSGSSKCVGGIVGEDTGLDFWIVGDVFMRNVYTVFDVDNSRVGFAELA